MAVNLNVPNGFDGRSWYTKMLAAGYKKRALADTSAIPLSNAWSSATKVDVEMDGREYGAYQYHGPGTSSQLAYNFSWSYGVSQSTYNPSSYGTLRPQYHPHHEPNGNGGPLKGRSDSSQILISCPRYLQNSGGVKTMHDPHMNYNPVAVVSGASEQKNYPELPQKAINRGYVDGHVKFIGRAE
jgi:hypothetical protein